jgi:hypothetical protein
MFKSRRSSRAFAGGMPKRVRAHTRNRSRHPPSVDMSLALSAVAQGNHPHSLANQAGLLLGMLNYSDA